MTSVTDTPADQGNRLDVQWKPSPLDQASLPRVVEYRIWRQAPLDTPVVALTVLATSACSYSATITTPVDSIVGVPTPDVRIWVEARNTTTGESWITLSKRGLAFDNLVPPVPAGLQAQMTWTGTRWLAASTWRKSTAPDVKEYRLYRSATQQLGGAVSAMGHFLAATTDTAWNDSLFDATEPNYYVLVVDQHGNVGAPAEAALTNLVGTPAGPGEGPAVVECKDVGLWGAADWRDDEAPLKHRIQVQAQLSVTGWDHGYLVGMIGGRPQIRRIERDDDFIGSLEAFAAKWWRDHMIDRLPAPPDASDATRRALLRLHPDDDGRAVRLDADTSRIYRELRDLKTVAKQAEQEIGLRENQLRAALGPHSFGRTDCGEWISYRTVVRKAHTRVVEESKGRTLYLGYKSVPRDVEFVEDTAADALTAAG